MTAHNGMIAHNKLIRHASEFAAQQQQYLDAQRENKMRLPRIIDKTWDYQPRIGDRIEATQGDLILIGTIADIANHGTCYTSNGYAIYYTHILDEEWSHILDEEWSHRLISRAKREFQVGDTISNEELSELPVGSVFTHQHPAFSRGFDVVVLAVQQEGNSQGLRSFRYRRVDTYHTWQSFNSGTNLLKYINS